MEEEFYYNLRASNDGHASAEVRDLSEPSIKKYKVFTTDFGKTWSSLDENF